MQCSNTTLLRGRRLKGKGILAGEKCEGGGGVGGGRVGKAYKEAIIFML